MFHQIKPLESGILVSGISKVWEYTDGCANKYMCALAVYLMTLLSSSYGIITDLEINSPGHRENFVDGLNAMYKYYLKRKMEIIGKLSSNDISDIGIIPSASKEVSAKFADQRIKIINNKERLNGLKVRTNIQKR